MKLWVWVAAQQLCLMLHMVAQDAAAANIAEGCAVKDITHGMDQPTTSNSKVNTTLVRWQRHAYMMVIAYTKLRP